jgi:hypothetical protein
MIRTRFTFAVFTLAWACCSAAHAQNLAPAAPSVRDARLPLPGVFQAALKQEPSAGEALPPGKVAEYEAAAPPPDPSPPRWGSLEEPVKGPLALPTYEYLLAAPPRNVLQYEDAQQYTRPLSDPRRLLRDDSRYNMPIDLYRPDGIAPVGVTGDHTLKNSTVFVSYRYLTTNYFGNLNGTHPVSAAGVLGQFPLAATRQRAQTHLMQIEYGLTDDFTFLAQAPIQQNSIDFVAAAGGTSKDSYTNFGDVKLSGLFVLKRWNHQQIHLNLGMNIPVGIINTLNSYPVFGTARLSYPVRTSSGSWDLMPGLTYRGQNEFWTWGFQAMGIIRTGRNTYGYELGDVVDLTPWIMRRFGSRWAGSARLDEQIWGHIRGADPRLDPALTQVNRPDLQGGRRLDMLFGLNYYLPDGRFPGQRLQIESGIPIYQSLHGPQLRARWILNVGWNMIW